MSFNVFLATSTFTRTGFSLFSTYCFTTVLTLLTTSIIKMATALAFSCIVLVSALCTSDSKLLCRHWVLLGKESIFDRGQPLLCTLHFLHLQFHPELWFLFWRFFCWFQNPLCLCTSFAIPKSELLRKQSEPLGMQYQGTGMSGPGLLVSTE
jgi:hypothetical protein